MKRTHVVVIGISLLLPLSTLPAQAQTGGRGSVITDTKIDPGDSPLVRAAKATAAWRTTLTAHAPTVIDNDTLRTSGGHFAEANDPSTGVPKVYPTVLGTGPRQDKGQINRGQWAYDPTPVVGGQLPRAETYSVTMTSAAPLTAPVQAGNQLTQAPPAGPLSQGQTTILSATPALPSLTPPPPPPPR